MAAAQQQLTPEQQNNLARALIKANSQKMTQRIQGGTIVPGNQGTININPKNVGLIQGFWVQIVATVTNGSAVQINLTDLGPSNILSQISFTDLNNNTRIQTSGWHMGLINSVKQRRPFGAALVRTTGFDSPVNYGSVFAGQISAPATIAAAGSGTVNMWYWVPLAYSENDLRGSVYANVLNATMQLQLVVNPAQNMVVQSGLDSTLAMYVGNAAGAVTSAVVSSLTYNVFQVYLDQLPTTNQGVFLPMIDLAFIYDIKNTSLTGITTGQDFPIQYANYRDFLSTSIIYVNTAATGARGTGADINYWALQAANNTNIWNIPPALLALKTRNQLQADLPPGTYYMPSREKPIATTQYGNMQVVLNPVTAGAGAYVLVGYEAFSLVQTLSMAGSLAAS